MLSSIERGRKRFWSSENAVALVQKASPHSGVDMRFHAVGADPIVGRYCARKELDAVPEGGVLHADRRENEQCFGGCCNVRIVSAAGCCLTGAYA